MIERLGYFKNIGYTYENGQLIISTQKLMPTYKDTVPREETEDCFRISFIDGSVLVEKWLGNKKTFMPIIASNNFYLYMGE